MAQKTSGFRAILGHARVYQLLQDVLGKRSRQRFIDTYVEPRPGELLLDVGCGTGEVVGYLPEETRYVGVDLSEAYIERARSAHGDRGRFFCGDVAELDFERLGRPDVVLAKGLLHHLDDEQVLLLFRRIAAILAEGGRLVTLDPCRLAKTHPVARFVISRDRGQNVRAPEEYARLAEEVFSEVRLTVRRDLLRIPYDHAILRCTEPARRSIPSE